MAAALAPLAFNLCLAVVFLLFFSPGDALIELLVAPVLSGLVPVLAAVPALAGYAAGTDGFVRFLGHSFYTHAGEERDFRFTLGIWAAMFCLAYLLSHAVA